MKENETLLDMAASNYRAALKVYKFATDDERELNTVGYLLQQAAELCIKHHLEVNGIRYAHSHIIEDLLDECVENNVPINFSETFYDFSPAISKWESKTRYIKNYKLSMNQIQRGFKLIKQFLMTNGITEDNLKLQMASVRNIEFF